MGYKICISGWGDGGPYQSMIMIPIENLMIAQQIKSLLRADNDSWTVSLLDDEDD